MKTEQVLKLSALAKALHWARQGDMYTNYDAQDLKMLDPHAPHYRKYYAHGQWRSWTYQQIYQDMMGNRHANR